MQSIDWHFLQKICFAFINLTNVYIYITKTVLTHFFLEVNIRGCMSSVC